MTPAGLCEQCAWHKEIRSDRGSVFHMCRRGLTDSDFPKYPRLPVRACRGFQPAPIDADGPGPSR